MHCFHTTFRVPAYNFLRTTVVPQFENRYKTAPLVYNSKRIITIVVI